MNDIGDVLGKTVRPAIALLFAIVACAAFLMGALNADQWLGLATMAISFYFATKTAENAVQSLGRSGQRRATDSDTSVQVEQADTVNVESAPPKPRRRT